MAGAGAPRARARGVTDLAIGSSDWLGPSRLTGGQHVQNPALFRTQSELSTGEYRRMRRAA
jgi:hypothetical protein